MDNAVEALLMAGSVLIFVIGLSIAILSFSQAREAIDTAIQLTDREVLSISEDSRFYYVAAGHNNTRNIGLDTLIPSLYRAYKESYKIVFDFQGADPNYYLYKDKKGNPVYKMEDVPDDSDAFVKGLLYRDFSDFGTGLNAEKTYKNQYNVGSFPMQTLYSFLNQSGIQIEEKMGVYDNKDLGESTSLREDDITSDIERKANEETKRVITYVITK